MISEPMNVYFISGLGADRRAFERLTLPDGYVAHYLDWIPPQPNESLNDYALRLGSSINTAEPFALVGLSMGGMIATILSQKLQPQKTVLISSIGCNKEFPRLLRFARRTGAHKVLPAFAYRAKSLFFIQFIAQRLMGTKMKGQKALIKYFVSQTDPRFIRWAIGAIVEWQDGERPANLIHIHGSKDRMFPLKCTTPDAVVKGGSHFMVWTKAGEVSKRLAEALR